MSRRLIEQWLPIAELGVESLRERTPMTPFPAPNRLHVWWARRPLIACRAAILASILPEDADRKIFLHVLGIHGNPVASKQRINLARQKGERFEGQAYDYPRAFSYTPSIKEKEWIRYESKRINLEKPILLDPTAGGGSIPFEGVRLGFESYANDLNPVAATILKSTIQFPLTYHLHVYDDFIRISTIFLERRESALIKYFPPESNADAIPTNWIWARSITCPYCDGLIPLSPNWRLAQDGTGVRLLPETAGGPNTTGRICSFEIVKNIIEQSEGTVARGSAACPYPDCNRVVDGDEVKRQAQDGGMGEQLFAIVFKKRIIVDTKSGRGREKWVRGYRAPRAEDDISGLIRDALEAKLPEWEALDMVPTEKFPEDTNDSRPIQYGMPLWRDLFSPRQQLCHGISVEVFRKLYEEETEKPDFNEVTKAAFGYLALSLDKLRDYNSRMSRWHVNREVMVNTFDRHDFSFKWSYAEMAPLIVGLGYEWAIEQTAKCISELVDLTRPDMDAKAHRKMKAKIDPLQQKAIFDSETFTPPPITISCKSGDSLDHIENQSVDVVVMDPPYYDNVMYAELSDFFYVWLKRTAGYVYPELFTRTLTDKENEAVANPAKFKGIKGAKKLADQDYRDRMAAIFAECRRVLKFEGIMTLMFTHKATGAWDALTKGLMAAGFVITASWPINTEADGSMHIKDKSAANSTIFLVCRPRPIRSEDENTLFWEDLEPVVRKAVRLRIQEFQDAGIRGVDLYLSSFGPALETFSRHWPVKRGQPKARPPQKRGHVPLLDGGDTYDPYDVTPEDALDAARHEVKNWRIEQLTSIQRQAELDSLTEWFVLAWDAFQAPQFPFDEALRLARVVGLDVENAIIGTLAEKKGSDIILWDSSLRASKGALGPTNGSRAMIDAIHHAAHIARTRTLTAAVELVEKTGTDKNPAFLKTLEAVLEVLPPSRAFTGFDPVKTVALAASDFEALEHLRRLAFSEQIQKPKQLAIWEDQA
jgi:adenine-specific DNA methylase